MTPAVALRAWLAAPGDAARQSALAAATAGEAVDAGAVVRLPGAALPALRSGPVPRLAALRPPVRQALLVCGLGQRLGLNPTQDEARELDTLPFTAGVAGEELVIELLPNASGQRFGNPFLHQWVAGLQVAAVVVECGRINHVNSVLIAWMLQLVQSAKPVPVRIRHAKAQVVTQLKQLRLDHLMIIE